ncbi:MAG: response regulator [Bacteroidota bacterium]
MKKNFSPASIIKRFSGTNTLLSIRIAYFCGATSLLLFSYWFELLYPEIAKPYWDRYIISGINILALLATFNKTLRPWFTGKGLYILLCIFSIDLGYINYLQHFHPFHLINSFVAIQLCFFLIVDKKWLIKFLLFAGASLFAALLFTEHIFLGNGASLTTLIIIMLGLNYQIQENRLSQEKKVLEAQSNLRRLSLVAEKTTNGVAILDAKAKFEWVNKTFEAISGYQEAELKGKSPLKLLIGPETSSKEIERMMQNLANGEAYEGEFLCYSKSGKARWQVLNITPVYDEQNKLINYIAIETDINARKKMETHLREAKEAAELAGIAKAEFLANMSHEIRTPMNAVIGMTGLLADSDLSSEQREYVDTIRVSGDNLLTVINDILDFSKIDSGKLELERQAFNLIDSVEDVMDMLSPKAHDKGLSLMYEIDAKVPTGIFGDPTRLNQVLVNLVNNAIKFTDRGEVIIQIQVEEKNCDQGCVLRFSVIDTGIGIPEERLGRLFKSFSQVDASTTRKYGGTGLGLAISKQLINLMGGEIGVKSQYGKGSTFSFSLPIEKAEVPVSHSIDLAQLAAQKAKILLIDDNTTNLRILEGLCQKWGVETISISNPRNLSAVLAEKIPFDLAILDMNMPHIDGAQLAQQIKQNEHYHSLPLIMLTSLAELSQQKDQSLFDAYLSKPFRQKHLLQNLAYFILKQTEQPERSRRENTQKDLSHYQKSILLVEDNLVNQKVATRMLQKLGLKADIAGNGLEALKALDHRPYDVLLMDMQMPEMDGLTATKEIRAIQSPYFVQPTIIAMTANAMKGDRERCLEAGMNDYISKPIKLSQLSEILSKWFDPAIALETNS